MTFSVPKNAAGGHARPQTPATMTLFIPHSLILHSREILISNDS